MDFTSALIVGLVLMGAKFLDWWASTQLARPIFCVAILGALLGHPTEGIILAAQLELVFIGNVSLGGVMPSTSPWARFSVRRSRCCSARISRSP